MMPSACGVGGGRARRTARCLCDGVRDGETEQRAHDDEGHHKSMVRSRGGVRRTLRTAEQDVVRTRRDNFAQVFVSKTFRQISRALHGNLGGIELAHALVLVRLAQGLVEPLGRRKLVIVGLMMSTLQAAGAPESLTASFSANSKFTKKSGS